MRIVSVCPSNTDLMAHLGLLHQVVGRDSWSDWPEGQVERIPVIGSVLDIDIAAVVALKPDLILASKNVPGMEKVVPKLEATGFPVVIYDPETWEDVLQNLLDLGKRIGASERAERVVADALAEVQRLENESSRLPWIELLVEWWPEPVIVPFRETYVNSVLGWVKVRTPFRERVGRSGIVTHEAVILANPDLYSISWCGTPWNVYRPESVSERFAAAPMKIISQPERIFKLWEGVIEHPSLRLLDGARQVLEHRRKLGL